ncbi:MAG: hypothetical protein R2854_10165 [Caldilineaceae bacterium]
MGWWAGWFGDKIYDDSIPPDGPLCAAVPSDAHAYIIFLSGIGRVSGQTLSYRPRPTFGGWPRSCLPRSSSTAIFPYSTNNLRSPGLFRRPVALGAAAQAGRTRAGRHDHQRAQRLPGLGLGRPSLRSHLQPGHRRGHSPRAVAL